jgi:hypothetical protein
MILTVILGFWFAVFNAKFNVITTRTMALLFGITLFSYLFFPKFTIKGYSIEGYFIKLIKSQVHS